MPFPGRRKRAALAAGTHGAAMRKTLWRRTLPPKHGLRAPAFGKKISSIISSISAKHKHFNSFRAVFQQPGPAEPSKCPQGKLCHAGRSPAARMNCALREKRSGCAKAHPPVFFLCVQGQPSLIALTGHSPAQVPQSRHASASITYLPSPSEMAPTGQTPAQVPQAMQSSLIL